MQPDVADPTSSISTEQLSLLALESAMELDRLINGQPVESRSVITLLNVLEHPSDGNLVTARQKQLAKDRLTAFITRVERLIEERHALNADIKEIFKEASGAGFDAKIMREVIRLRAMDPSDMIERQSVIEVYLRALGNLGPT